MAEVFISYVWDDKAAVDRLANELRQRGLEVWVDDQKLQPGDRWREVIKGAIERGSFFVACFSQKWRDKPRSYMNEELLEAGRELRLRPRDRAWFIPVSLDGIKPLEYALGESCCVGDFQILDLSVDWQEQTRKLAKALGAEDEIRLSQEPSAGQGNSHDQEIELDLQGMLLSELITLLRIKTGFNIITFPEVALRVTFSGRLPWYKILRHVSEDIGYAVRFNGPVALVAPRLLLKRQEELFPIPREYGSELVSMRLSRASLLETLKSHAEALGTGFFAGRRVSDMALTIELERVPLKLAVDTICRMKNLRWVIEDGALVIEPMETLESHRRIEMGRRL